MYYTCEGCKYTFVNREKPERGPDCGKEAVREAAEAEIKEYQKFRKEFND